MRRDGRGIADLRPVSFALDFIRYPEGSVLVSMGATQVLCNVTIQDGVPRWMDSQKVAGGWITAEYALLPRATQVRTRRETSGLRGRTQEIRRMIARSLRAAVDLGQLGWRTCIVDCDVLQADGGTRTASVTGGYVALALALQRLIDQELAPPGVLLSPVASVSVGVVGGEPLLDLDYSEDSQAEVDVNVVMNAQGKFIELQGTAEGRPFSRAHLERMLELAELGIGRLLAAQEVALDGEI